jgi:diadenosine tetraphosphatase ApaH/serine/threonine PP2A family protein phosphatase
VVKRAIVSDIHGNLDALEAVLADAKLQGVEQFICLGDVVGYGPQPRQCVDRVIEFEATILGNHDLSAVFDPEGFNSAAEQAIFWTRSQLEQCGNESPEAIRRRLEFLCRLPRWRRENDVLFVHGSARNPTTEYVFPEDVFNRRKLEKIFSLVPRVCFQGHTHVPGVFTENEFFTPDKIRFQWTLDQQRVMINVGSIGQPRDSDPRACYCIWDDPHLHFRRVPYDIEAVVAKIEAIPELDNFLGYRLRDGR